MRGTHSSSRTMPDQNRSVVRTRPSSAQLASCSSVTAASTGLGTAAGPPRRTATARPRKDSNGGPGSTELQAVTERREREEVVVVVLTTEDRATDRLEQRRSTADHLGLRLAVQRQQAPGRGAAELGAHQSRIPEQEPSPPVPVAVGQARRQRGPVLVADTADLRLQRSEGGGPSRIEPPSFERPDPQEHECLPVRRRGADLHAEDGRTIEELGVEVGRDDQPRRSLRGGVDHQRTVGQRLSEPLERHPVQRCCRRCAEHLRAGGLEDGPEQRPRVADDRDVVGTGQPEGLLDVATAGHEAARCPALRHPGGVASTVVAPAPAFVGVGLERPTCSDRQRRECGSDRDRSRVGSEAQREQQRRMAFSHGEERTVVVRTEGSSDHDATRTRERAG